MRKGRELRGLLHLAAAEAGRADPDPFRRSIDDGPNALQVHVPAPVGDVVRVADPVPKPEPFHRSHKLLPSKEFSLIGRNSDCDGRNSGRNRLDVSPQAAAMPPTSVVGEFIALHHAINLWHTGWQERSYEKLSPSTARANLQPTQGQGSRAPGTGDDACARGHRFVASIPGAQGGTPMRSRPTRQRWPVQCSTWTPSWSRPESSTWQRPGGSGNEPWRRLLGGRRPRDRVPSRLDGVP